MPVRWITGIALAALAATAPLRAESVAARTVIARCAAHKPAIHGWTALRTACPGIERALARLRVRALLPNHWRRTLTSTGLGELSSLARRYRGRARSALPDPATLRSIALGLGPRRPPAAPPSLWARLFNWVHGWIAPIATLLERWLRSLAREPRDRQLLVEAIWLVGAALIATAVLAIILQLRAAGLLGSKYARSARRPRRASPAHPPAAPPPATPDWAALRARPSGLLCVLIDALLGAHRLDRARDLTCRELIARARFDNEAQRRGFAQIALLAERQRFGPDAALTVPESMLLEARTLHAQLGSPPGDAGEDPR